MSLSETERPLELDLSCPICLQLFSNPVSLPCGHVYCLACLRKYMDTNTAIHCCPECKAEYQGPHDLVKNFKMCSIIQSYKATRVAKAGSLTDGHSPPADVSAKRSNAECPLGGQQQKPRCSAPGDEELVDVSPGAEPSIMDESKLLLASQVAELTVRLRSAEEHRRREEEREADVRVENGLLRGKAARLLEQMTEMTLRYVSEVTELIEAELRPGEESLSSQVRQASEVERKLRETRLQAESLLKEQDGTMFTEKLLEVHPHIMELMAQQPVGELEDDDARPVSTLDPNRACAELDRRSLELREGLGVAQRSLRNILNPSEVTFDRDTAHPCLVISEDMKTVTFSAKKQPYPDLPTRFSSFIQVLSTQSFYGGEHRWEVELDGYSPWIIGVCYSRLLERSGLASALESSRGSWCLMWFDNLLRSFEQGHNVPLKRTPIVRRLEITLSFKTQRLSFYNISECSGKTHVYTFKAKLTEPVNLAYRLMSGQPKARITVCS